MLPLLQCDVIAPNFAKCEQIEKKQEERRGRVGRGKEKRGEEKTHTHILE